MSEEFRTFLKNKVVTFPSVVQEHPAPDNKGVHGPVCATAESPHQTGPPETISCRLCGQCTLPQTAATPTRKAEFYCTRQCLCQRLSNRLQVAAKNSHCPDWSSVFLGASLPGSGVSKTSGSVALSTFARLWTFRAASRRGSRGVCRGFDRQRRWQLPSTGVLACTIHSHEPKKTPYIPRC